MGDLYTIDEGGGTFWQPVPEFDTSNDAETFAAGYGHAGTAILRSTYLAGPEQQAIDLEVAKQNKIRDLVIEGNSRSEAVNISFKLVRLGLAIGQSTRATSLEADGVSWVAVANAFAVGTVEINALTTVNDVDNYNVVTDPPWP